MNRIMLLGSPHARWTRTIAEVHHTKKMLSSRGFEDNSLTVKVPTAKCRERQASMKNQKQAKNTEGERKKIVQKGLLERSNRQIPLQTLLPNLPKAKTLSDIIQPVQVTQNQADSRNIGEELTGQLDKDKLQELLERVCANNEILELLQTELQLDGLMPKTVMESFSKYCLKSTSLPVSLHVQLYDLLNGAGVETELAPFVLEHGRKVYPHCTVMDDIEQLCISNMTNPFSWFPDTREMKRKIIYHSGPTNSGKTFAALESFLKAKTGVYLAPLRLLAIECCTNTNSKDVPCDLLTGERKYFVNSKDNPANHKSCTIEMLDLNVNYDVAVIDEIQMIADKSRGGHWTTALLGVKAKEVHVCGDGSVINLVKSFAKQCGDSFQLKKYKRKSPLTIQDKPLGSLENVKPGDCIVCFQVKHVFDVAEQLIEKGYNCAIIYGALPPGIKIHQTEIFNDQNNSCNVLVATDAVGMGLNLAIQRIIFYGIEKQTLIENNTALIKKYTNKKIQITPSQARQIAGRAGRYGGLYNRGGEVTAFHEKDLIQLKDLLNQEIPDLERAGLTVRDDVVETIAYHLPGVPLSSILMIFVAVCKTDSQFFLCNTGFVIQNAMLLDHIKMPIRDKLLFCQAPLRHAISSKSIVLYMKMASLVSKGQMPTLDWFMAASEFSMSDLQELKSFDHALEVFHMTDIYLWLCLRFTEFQDEDKMRSFRIELDKALRNYIEKTFSNIGPEAVIRDTSPPREVIREASPPKDAIRKVSPPIEVIRPASPPKKAIRNTSTHKEVIRKASSLETIKTIGGDKELKLMDRERLQILESPKETESDRVVLDNSSQFSTVPETVTQIEVKPFSLEDSDKILTEIWYESINYKPGEIKKKAKRETLKLATAGGRGSKTNERSAEVKKEPKERSSTQSVDPQFVGDKLKGFVSFLQMNKLNIKDGAVKWRGMSDQEQEVYMNVGA